MTIGDKKEVQQVCSKLATTYGSPRLNNPSDPLDDLIFIFLSNKTTPETAQLVYRNLKAHYPCWFDLIKISADDLAAEIKIAGLARIRSQFILESVKKIHFDFGITNLRFLASEPEQASFEYLCSLPGVSNKVAKCVMLYTLGFEVLPVDAHVFRLAQRLGWTTKNRADLSHRELEQIVPSELRYSFHVNAVAHGRSRCRPQNPYCGDCPIITTCRYESKSKSVYKSLDQS